MVFKWMLRMILFGFGSALFAQIPKGYYDVASGLMGDELKEALYHIIDDHTQYPYTSTSIDVWTILSQSDRDPDSTGNVILLYTGKSVNAAQEYNLGKGWSREHVWAKSHGDFGTELGAGTDLHHLKPADVSVNSARNNRDFDYAEKPYFDDAGTVPTDCFSDTYIWEPPDEVKGDVARMIFYMATRYNGEHGEPDLSIKDDVNTIALCDNDRHIGYMGKLSALLEWHDLDPVDAFETHRNNVIFSYQGNRNPFIDNPDYVNAIWSCTRNVCVGLDALTVEVRSGANGLSILSKPSGTSYLKLYDLSGRIIRSQAFSAQVNLNGLAKGVYLLVVSCDDLLFTSKLVI